jgi:hypothetical protein
MYIEFNIALNGKHFFATHKRSCTNSEQAIKLNEVLQDKFPESEGYSIKASLHPQRSYGIDLSKGIAFEVNSILTVPIQ